MTAISAHRMLTEKNQILRDQYTRLKIKKEELSEHLSTILKRSKQMQKLKLSLNNDLQRTIASANQSKNKKMAYVNYLYEDIKKLDADLLVDSTQFKKLQNEYQLCLKDYDIILKSVSQNIQSCRILQLQIANETESGEGMKAMIFDYERLKRVLEQQRNYFLELSSSESKSHEERVKQLQKIFQKLSGEQKVSEQNLRLKKIGAGFIRLHHIIKNRVKGYSEVMVRNFYKIDKKTKLGIKIFRNCLELANFKHQQSTRKLFYKWHHNIFNKENLRNLVENATKHNIESKKKMQIMNNLVEQMYDRNMGIFHLYEKSKYLTIIANKVSRKDLHLGFSRWRQNYTHKSQISNHLSIIIEKNLPNSNKRLAFTAWRNNAAIQNRYILANHLLQQYMTVKQVSRVFRKWRFEIPRHELKIARELIQNLKLRNKISSKVQYEKRKSKALTSLTFNLTKIKIRNYFIKYWANVKGVHIEKHKTDLQNFRSRFSALRAENKVVIADIATKNQRISLKVFKSFMFNSKLRPAFKKWRNTSKILKKRQEAIYHLGLKNVQKTKTFVMNQFRKCVQFFEKKQMHQVLTDLNKKMQAINEKSTIFRQKLQKCIQDLGQVASKKLDELFDYTIRCQQRVYFNTDLRKNVSRLYKQYVLHRFSKLLQLYVEKKFFNQISLHSKDRTKDIKLQKIYKTFFKAKQKRYQQTAFYALKGSLKTHKNSFQRLGHSQNILLFYRMASAFVAIEKRNYSERTKAIHKKIKSNEAIFKVKQENIVNLQDQKQKLQQSLKKIFQKFIPFEDRNLILKQNRNNLKLSKRYFERYRKNVQQKIHAERILLHFSEFISHKNNQIFWRGANAIKYQNTITIVKDELSKLNRKKKTFEQKSQKGIGDIDKRLEQAEAIHLQKQNYYTYYLTKFENTLKFYEVNHKKKQKFYYLSNIFKAWKRQYQGTKRLTLGTNKILQRNLVHPAFHQISKLLRDQSSKLKSQYLCADILFKKAKNCMKDCILLWRCNLRKIKSEKLDILTNEMIYKRQDVADECKSKSNLVAIQRLRAKRVQTLAKCFMSFKNQLHEKIYDHRFKIEPHCKKWNEINLRRVFNGLKWRVFYKKTKKSYINFKKNDFVIKLKADVFLSLKIYRQEHYKLVGRISGIYNILKKNHLQYSFDKIKNQFCINRDTLNYERKKALRHLVMNKVTKVQLIKLKILKKWQAWLIPRSHYLPNAMKNVQICTLRRHFASIKQHAYWNQIYIKKAADLITSEGYSEINTATNNLVKQGYDPDEIKQYLTNSNEKDTKNIKLIINRIKLWGNKQMLVRAWNSWKQYLVLKSKIRKSISKVLNIAQGLGRYWNRWRSKDPEFNAILQKQSRGNMLQRYRDLGRLLKQYKRDVKQNKIYCQELKQINDEYAQKNNQNIKLALSAFSGSLKKGLKQGLQIWRTRVREHKKSTLDQRYEQLSQGISILMEQKSKMKIRLLKLKEENNQIKQKCFLGKQCGQILQKLLRQRDNMSIDLADKQHNLKLLLQDNLRLKQKIKSAKNNAQKLISQVNLVDES